MASIAQATVAQPDEETARDEAGQRALEALAPDECCVPPG